MSSILLSPPIVFIIFLVLLFLISTAAKKLAPSGKDSPGKTESYACGESSYENMGQPDYSQFFVIAFFFTIMHVAVLMLATVPAGMTPMAALYFVAAIVGLLILFRK